MKVLLLIWNYWPALEGGSERQARKVANELARRGHTCTVWTAWHEASLPHQEIHDGVTIRRFGRWVPFLSRCQRLLTNGHCLLKRMLGGLSPRAMMRYEIFRQQFDFWALLVPTWVARRSFMQEILQQTWGIRPSADIIHLHEPSWLGGFAVWMAQPWKIPVLCQEATNPALPILGYDVPRRRDIGRWRKEAHFIAMAQYLTDDLLAKGIPFARIHLLPNGVRIPDTIAHPENNDSVLYVGNFSQGAHWKAFDVLFDAWGLVYQNNPQARLIVLGGGDSSPWQNNVIQQGCACSVDFMGKVNDPGRYYRDASLFVLPSRVEGMSNALLESQSWGVPCVVSDIPGNRAIVQDGINGLIVPLNNPQALASSILRLLANPDERKRLGYAGRSLAEQQFDMDKVMDSLLNLYQNLATNAGNHE